MFNGRGQGHARDADLARPQCEGPCFRRPRRVMFEVVVVFLLAGRFQAIDWVALAFKLSYLSLMAYAGLGGPLYGSPALGPLLGARPLLRGVASLYLLHGLPSGAGDLGSLYPRLPALAVVNAVALATGLGMVAVLSPYDALALTGLGDVGLAYCRSRLYAAITSPSKSL